MNRSVHFFPPSPRRVIALVGGIASGKSTASSMLTQQILPQYFHGMTKNLSNMDKESLTTNVIKSPTVYIDADRIGHSIYQKGKPAYYEVIDCFGDEIVDRELGEINRRLLGQIVFSNQERMTDLQNIVWPRIQQEIQEQLDQIKEGIVILEAAILLEANWTGFVDEIWCFSVDREVAIRRLKSRNGLSKEEAEKRIDSQWSNEKRERFAHVVLKTNTEASTLPPRLDKLFVRRFRHLCLPKFGILLIDRSTLESRYEKSSMYVSEAISHLGTGLTIFAFNDSTTDESKSTDECKHIEEKYITRIIDEFNKYYTDIVDVKELKPLPELAPFQGQVLFGSNQSLKEQIGELFSRIILPERVQHIFIPNTQDIQTLTEIVNKMAELYSIQVTVSPLEQCLTLNTLQKDLKR